MKDVLWAAEALSNAASSLPPPPPLPLVVSTSDICLGCRSSGPAFVFAVSGPELDPAYAVKVRVALLGADGRERPRFLALSGRE